MRWPWSKAESDLDREVRYHVETLADAYEREGLPREQALNRARADFGGVEQVKEQCRDESRWRWVAEIGQDLRFGWRMMHKSPATTVAAVVSLALGIGATTAIFSLGDALLWRTLEVPAPEELVELHWEVHTQPEGLIRGSSGSNFRDGGLRVADFFSPMAFEAMRERAAGSAQVAAHLFAAPVSANFHGNVSVSRMRAVTGNFFPMLGVQPFGGRLLAEADESPAAAPVVVTTHRFWKNQLGARGDAIGQAIRVNNTAYVIVGILPPGFTGITPGDPTELYAPLRQSPQWIVADSWYRERQGDPKAWWMQLLARKSPGVGGAQLHSMLQAAFASTWAVQPKAPEQTPRVRLIDAARGLGSVRRDFGDPVAILLTLVILVLLVACANIANLLLARSVEREKEVALRVSLGCSRRRLMRQFLTESLLLAGTGGTASIGVGWALGRLMLRLMPDSSGGMLLTAGPDLRAFGATAAITAVTALIFGLYPAWRATRVDPAPALKEGGGGAASRGRWRPAQALVLAQLSLGVLLVTAAIVFPHGLNRILSRDTGFEREHLLLFDLSPGEVGYTGERLRLFWTDLDRRLGALAGVEAAGLSMIRPMRGGGFHERVQLPGRDEGVQAAVHAGTASFLRTLGVPLASGRAMTAQESASGGKVAVVSEDLVKQLAMTAPLGMRVRMLNEDYSVIGVARNARYSRLTVTQPVLYVPFDYTRARATVAVRSSPPPQAITAAVREAVREIDPNLPLIDLYTMEQQISRTLQRERVFAWLCGSFGVLALVLCVVGLYGLMSHTTARRTSEIGIRMALGADRRTVLVEVLRDGMRLALLGLLLGLPLAYFGVRVAAARNLFPDGPVPYWTLGAAIGVLVAAARAATWAPA